MKALTEGQARAVRKLAVAYEAWLRCMDQGQNGGAAIWGSLMIEAQDELGVEMVAKDVLTDMVAAAKASLLTERE